MDKSQDQELVDNTSIGIIIFVPIALVFSLMRITTEGVLGVMYLHVALYLLGIFNYLYLRKKSFYLSSWFLILFFLLIHIGAIFENESVRHTSAIYLVSILLSSMFLSFRSFVAYFVLGLILQYICLYFAGLKLDHLGIFGNNFVSVIVVYAIYKMRRRLKDTIEVKDVFFSNMTHELRTPLNGMIGGVSLLKETPLSEKQRELLEIVDFSNQTLLSIVNDILDLSKLEKSKIELLLENHDLNTLLKSVISFHSVSADSKLISLNLDTTIEDSKSFKIDSIRLTQILNNLLSNAIKFTEKGEVKLCVKSLNKFSSGEEISFEVKDTGIGIKKERLEAIFNPFTQEDLSTTKRYGGTGLGLSISKELVKIMGGELSVESEMGKGTEFYFSLKLNYSTDTNEVKENDRVSSEEISIGFFENNISVLIAEDNSINRKMLKLMLEKYGIKADFAHDGEEVLEALEYKKYNLIFMDIMMPKVDGIEATKKIREKENEGVYIIGCSAKWKDVDDPEAIGFGMNSSIGKPISRDHLEEVLAKFLKEIG